MLQDTYQIIRDKDKLLEFIEWLPDLTEGERFYVALFGRKKYCAEIKYIKTDKAQCKRFLSKKEDLYKKILKLETALGSYDIKGTEVPQEALALYISANPRDLEAGTRNSLIKLAQLLGNKYNGYNPHNEVMSEIHKSCSRKVYYDFDFDNIEWESIKDRAFEALPPQCYDVMQTRGGFHLIVRLKDIPFEFSKTWYKKLTSIEGIDVRGDNLLPVVGCTQGNFIPHFIKL